YPSHKGVTNELLNLKPNDELVVGESWGTIGYKGEGLFIAGGAGITPFISILRHLKSKNELGGNKLIFANKAKADIINEDEFKRMLGKNFINVLSDERAEGYGHGYVTKGLLQPHLEKGGMVYVCGPGPMMEAVEKQLMELGVDGKAIVKEEF
nr:flavodoxin reductase [Cyclobacteriaceae bacterium]